MDSRESMVCFLLAPFPALKRNAYLEKKYEIMNNMVIFHNMNMICKSKQGHILGRLSFQHSSSVRHYYESTSNRSTQR